MYKRALTVESLPGSRPPKPRFLPRGVNIIWIDRPSRAYASLILCFILIHYILPYRCTLYSCLMDRPAVASASVANTNC